MIPVARALLLTVQDLPVHVPSLQLELLTLRHQSQVLQRTRPRRVWLTPSDRWWWVCLSRMWTDWRRALIVSDYKDKYYGPVSRERGCGVFHQTIEEAIVHAEQHLGCFRKPMTPYRGTTGENEGVIVGFAINARRRVAPGLQRPTRAGW